MIFAPGSIDDLSYDLVDGKLVEEKKILEKARSDSMFGQRPVSWLQVHAFFTFFFLFLLLPLFRCCLHLVACPSCLKKRESEQSKRPRGREKRLSMKLSMNSESYPCPIQTTIVTVFWTGKKSLFLIAFRIKCLPSFFVYLFMYTPFYFIDGSINVFLISLFICTLIKKMNMFNLVFYRSFCSRSCKCQIKTFFISCHSRKNSFA